MKKLLFLMMALLVAPAMAAVTISLEPVGECSVEIVVTADGADTVDGVDVYSLVAGIALNVSVSPGQIDSVTGYMTAGVSTAADPGCGIYMGTITFTGGEPEAIFDVGTPVAPNTAPDAPGIIPGPACVLEAGCLFDVGVPADASLARTVLATLNLSETTTVTVTEEIATRGGIVLIGGGAPSDVIMPDPTLVTCGPLPHLTLETAVFPAGHPREGQNYYQDWLDAGSPDCWAYPRQCWGDADGKMFSGKWVLIPDLTEFINSWDKDPGEDGFNICADFDHAFFSGKRVLIPDLGIFIASWDQDIPGNCGGSLVPPE